MAEYYFGCPEIIKEFLLYMETIRNLSPRTIEGYWVDLRTFFRYIKQKRRLIDKDVPFEEISVEDVDLSLVGSISTMDIYEYLHFVMKDRENSASTRSRKISALRSYYKYLTLKAHKLDNDPAKDLEVPALKKTLPKYLSLEQSIALLNSVDGDFKDRDYCMLVLLLNCGMRLSELVGIDISDIHEETITITDRNALFLSRTGSRLTPRRVEQIINSYIDKAGLSGLGFTVHKLRHTAATLMYRYGNVDVLALKEILGHAHTTTTEIYTHLDDGRLRDAADSSPLADYDVSAGGGD